MNLDFFESHTSCRARWPIEHTCIPTPNHTQLVWKADSCLGTRVFQFEVHLIFIELFEPRVPSAQRHALVGRGGLSFSF